MRRQALVAGLHSYLTEHDSLFKQVDLPLAGLEPHEILHLVPLPAHGPDAEEAPQQQPAQRADVFLSEPQTHKTKLLSYSTGQELSGSVSK